MRRRWARSYESRTSGKRATLVQVAARHPNGADAPDYRSDCVFCSPQASGLLGRVLRPIGLRFPFAQ